MSPPSSHHRRGRVQVDSGGSCPPLARRRIYGCLSFGTDGRGGPVSFGSMVGGIGLLGGIGLIGIGPVGGSGGGLFPPRAPVITPDGFSRSTITSFSQTCSPVFAALSTAR